MMLPDTQHYSDSAQNYANFTAQTQWIADHRLSNGLVFTAQVGDLVQNGAAGGDQNQTEWDRASAAFALVDSLAPTHPYVACAGNHDYDAVANKASASQYLAHFGPSRYLGQSAYLESSPNGMNHAHRFQADGRDWLSLGLEWHPSDAALAWAQSILNANPDVPALISTHEHLDSGSPAVRRSAGDTPDSDGDNSGESVYRKLVEPFPQVFLVLSGHVHSTGRLASTTALGQPVLELLADYQDDPNGGNGWMQRLEFRPETSEIAISTLSPTYLPGTTAGADRSSGGAVNFTWSFDSEGHRAQLASTTTLHFREGQDAGFGVYAGTRDTHIGDGGAGNTLPGTSHGHADSLRIDGNQDHERALIRFENVFGSGPGQIPPGTQIDSAVLTLTTEGSNAQSANGARLYRMLVDWSEDATWDSLGDGIDLGDEARLDFDADTAGSVSSKGTDSFDVTKSVQAWLDGQPSHGWVAVAGGDDRWAFRSSEWGSLVERPMLTVRFDPQAPRFDPMPDGTQTFDETVFGSEAIGEAFVHDLMTRTSRAAEVNALFQTGLTGSALGDLLVGPVGGTEPDGGLLPATSLSDALEAETLTLYFNLLVPPSSVSPIDASWLLNGDPVQDRVGNETVIRTPPDHATLRGLARAGTRVEECGRLAVDVLRATGGQEQPEQAGTFKGVEMNVQDLIDILRFVNESFADAIPSGAVVARPPSSGGS